MKKEKTTMELFHELDNKSQFMRDLAARYDMAFASVKNHWMYGSIPKDKEEDVREMIIEALNEQKQIA